MTAVVLVFAGLGGAVFLLGYAVVPRRAPLVVEVARYDAAQRRRPPAAPSAPVISVGGWAAAQLWAGRHATRAARGRPLLIGAVRGNLELLGRSDELLVGAKVLAAVYGLLLPAVVAVALAAGGVILPPIGVAVAALFAAAVLYMLPDWAVRREAAGRRRDFRRAFGAYLDLVAMSLAAGRGVSQALPAAAAIGAGRSFRLLADTIAESRLMGITPWQALGELGERIRVPELVDLAGALTLVAHDGAKVRDSLAARASTLRHRHLADAQGQAEQADQSMRLAQLLLAFGFFLLIAYPAAYHVLVL